MHRAVGGWKARVPGNSGNPARLLIATLALAFFFAPVLAAAVGVRAPTIENHKLGRLPQRADGWSSFGVFDSWATDHLPLRNVAINANTSVERNVFRETPDYGANGTATTTTAAGVAGISAPQPAVSAAAIPAFPTVVAGTGGWLFYGTDFRAACNPTLSATVIAQRLARLSEIISKAGKTFVMIVAPDKSNIYPEYLPAADQGATCTSKAQAALWSALAANPPGGYQDLRTALLAAKAAAPATLLYRKLDTHWNARGALIYAHLLADSLNPQLWPTLHVTPLGDKPSNTDLSALLGTKQPEEAPVFEVSRPGVVQTTDTAVQVTNKATNGTPLVTGRTLFISDSFTEASRFAINPFFRDAGFINSIAAQTEFDLLRSTISSAKTVILEIVERDVVGGEAPILQTPVLDHLAASLASIHR